MSTASTPMPPPEAPAPPSAPHPFVRLAAGEPIRANLFGLEHLEAHARHLAESCRAVSPKAPGDLLLRRFTRNGRDLAHIHHEIVAAGGRQEPITPDAEWLLDNFHIIEETLREVRHDLPRGYYQKLPKLTAGPFAGLPRVYALGVELVAHTDGSLDETNITRFVQAFQAVTPLTIGELCRRRAAARPRRSRCRRPTPS
jgi:cyclic beta-1,2-glucan synthetase